MKCVFLWVGAFLFMLTGCQGQAINPKLVQTRQVFQNGPVNTNSPASASITYTPDPVFIAITSIQKSPDDQGVNISWEAEGNFPQGFKIVFSEQNVAPALPMDAVVSIQDGSARQGKVLVKNGKTIYFRICKYNGKDCSYYSEVKTYQESASDLVEKPDTATFTEEDNTLTITRISSQGDGQALLEWRVQGKFDNGFKIVWSKTKAAPTFPEDPSLDINDLTTRSAELSGDMNVQYFYRICKYDGRKCVLYSNSYAYTFDGNPLPTSTGNKITITNISDQSQGKALVSWNAIGAFPKGFKVIWSSTNAYPVYPGDKAIYLIDGSSRSAVVSGMPGTLYYFRVCEFNGSSCSQSIPFRYAAEPTPVGGLINITSISTLGAGKALVKWNADGSFPNGFKVVWSNSNPNPVYPGDNSVYFSEPSTRSAQVSALQGEINYFRVCRYTGSGCDIYSQSYTFTYGNPSLPADTPAPGQISILSLMSSNPGKAVIVWNASGGFPYGFKVVWSDSNPAPVYPGNDFVYLSDPGARSAQVSGDLGKSYYFRVCRETGSGCDLYSSNYKFTYSGIGTQSAAPEAMLTFFPIPVINNFIQEAVLPTPHDIWRP